LRHRLEEQDKKEETGWCRRRTTRDIPERKRGVETERRAGGEREKEASSLRENVCDGF